MSISKHIKDVNYFYSIIKQISDQTKDISINAKMEAIEQFKKGLTKYHFPCEQCGEYYPNREGKLVFLDEYGENAMLCPKCRRKRGL